MRFLALCLLIALSACGLPANVVVLLPDEGGTVGAVSVDRNNTKEDLSVPYAATDTAADKSSRSVFVADQKTVEAEFSRTSEHAAQTGGLRNILSDRANRSGSALSRNA